ncbi:MAG TPA: DMT family transporter [Candidatus Limnocylindrales bacterium]|nr:DMT family transporter [Candidatus Limnocylindrales bacterium]
MLSPELTVLVFGLLAAASWGAADFAGGLASRRASSLVVVLASQSLGIWVAAAAAVVRGEPPPTLADVGWGAIAGTGGAIALVGFYRALAVGRVSTVAPIAGVIAAAVPVAAGAVLEGAPGVGQAVGIGLALVAVVLVSGAAEEDHLPSERSRRESLALAVVGGVGFGLFYVFIHQVSADVVFWPLVASRVASLTVVAVLVLATRPSFAGLRSALPLVAIAGALDVGGNAGFLLADQAGRLDVASVLSSLYPVATVVLAILLLRERVGRQHALGMAAAFAAIVLIAGGGAG